MAYSVGAIEARLTARTAEFTKGFDQATSSVQRMQARLSAMTRPLADVASRLNRVGAAARQMAVVAGAATAGVALGLRASINAASDMTETVNLLRESFGPLTDETIQWANTTAETVGRSRQQMRQFAATLQAMLVPMVGSQEQAAGMSRRLAELAVDLGSFFNVADDEALIALRSALAGETEPMRRFGVVLTEAQLQAFAFERGISQSVQTMSEAEKVALRYEFILSRTALAQGDAERTAGSYSNRVKALGGAMQDLREEIGVRLLPVATRLVEAATAGVRWFNDLDSGTQDLILRIGGFAAAAIGAVAALGVLSFALGTLGTVAAFFGAVLGLVFSPFVLGIAVAIGAAAMLKTAWDNNLGGIQDKAQAVWDVLRPIYEAVKEKVAAAWDLTVNLLGDAAAWVRDTAIPWIKEHTGPAIKTAWDWTIGFLGTAWQWLKDTAWPWLSKSASTAWDWTIDFLGTAWAWLRDTAWPWLSKAASTAWEWTLSFLGDTWKWLRDTAWPWLSKAAVTTWNWTVEWANSAAEWLVNTAWPWLSRAAFTVWEWFGVSRNALMRWLYEKAWPWISNAVHTTWEFTVKGLEWLKEFWESLTNPESWKSEWVWPPQFRQGGIIPGLQHGAVLPGSSGPDKFPAILAPGEAVVPSWAVRGGWPTTLAWFRAMGVPGFQTGLAPSTIAAASRASGMDVGAIIQPLQEGFSGLIDFIKQGFASIFAFVLDLVDKLGPSILGEEQYAKLKASISDLRGRVQALLSPVERASDEGMTLAQEMESLKARMRAAQQAIEPSLWEKAKSAIMDMVRSVGDLMVRESPILSDVTSAVQTAAPGGPQAMAVAGITTLLAHSETFGKIMSILNGLLQVAADAIGAFLEPLLPLVAVVATVLGPMFEMLGTILANLLLPALSLLFPVIKFAGVVLLYFARSVAWGINQFIAGINLIIRGINWALGWLGVKIKELATINLANFDDAIRELNNLTWDSAKAKAEELAATKSVTEALTNVPEGFKVALARFTAMTPQPIPMAEGGIVTRPTLAIVGERGPEAVVPLGRDGATGSKSVTIGPVYIQSDDPERIWRDLQRIIERENVRGGGTVVTRAPQFVGG